ncbi:MAG: hypothetical protein E7545_08520 [Ruminococcaceae bacterium]|nr:hypothetical protein [Oscillospiraceae bacterium]
MLENKWVRYILKGVAVFLAVVILIMAVNVFTQNVIAHIDDPFTPQYDRVTLTEQTDYETIFLQTGLGKVAAEKLINEGKFSEILEAQDLFFSNDEIECLPLIKWFTREERLENELIPLYDLQPGDILVTLSTHTWGWRHGHCAIVIDEYTTVESISMGVNSSKGYMRLWQDYSNFAVLRVKDKTLEERKEVANFTLKKLLDKPYSLLSGFGFNKAPDVNSKGFSLHCSYLAWYAWNAFGVDLDSDKGRLATSYDILHSDKVEIVQLYGMDPNEFI